MSRIYRNLGTVAMEPKGEYNSSTYYEKLNMVNYEGVTYVAKEAVQGEAPSSSTKWQKLMYGSTIIFDNVAEMKDAASLEIGMTVETSGYYSANDGGRAKYAIRVRTSDDVEDNGFIHFIDDDILAELIIEDNVVNIKSLGAKSQDKLNNRQDIKTHLEKYLNYNAAGSDRVKLYIPAGVYYTTPVDIASTKGFYIYGDESFGLNAGNTIISSYNDNQNYIFNIGNSSAMTQYFVLKNITFSTADYTYSTIFKTFWLASNNDIKTINDSVVKMKYCQFGITDNLFFSNIKGKALNMSSIWEIYFKLLNFRNIRNESGCILCFDTRDTTLNEYANITACNFEKIMFEQVVGNLIECNRRCDLFNCKFGLINFEDYRLNYSDVTYSTDLSDLSDYTMLSIIRLNAGAKVECCINDIHLNNVATRYSTIDNTKYCYDNIINSVGQSGINNHYAIIINNIQNTGQSKDIICVKTDTHNADSSKISINNIQNGYGEYNYLFPVTNIQNIKINNYQTKGQNTSSTLECNSIQNGKVKSFSDYVYRNGLITYDSDSNSRFGLVNVIQGNLISNLISCEGKSKLNIRAKIPNGVSTTLTIYSSSHYKTLSVTGTGDFEEYTFDISSQTGWNYGDLISVHGTNDGNTLLFDTFYWE